MTISAVIPAYNEEMNIASTIDALRSIGMIDEIIVVDDGSIDQTADMAVAEGVTVISLPENKGKAAALAEGVMKASGDILCFVDADLDTSAVEFAHLISPVANKEVDMTIAAFPKAKRKGGFGLVKGLAVFGIAKLAGYRALSPLSGQRVLRRAVWDCAYPRLSGFGVEVGLTVQCLRSGYTLREVPVMMTHRETGRDLAGFKHRGRQFVDLLRTFSRLLIKRKVKI